MLIKLTYLNNGNPTLIAIEDIEEAYTVYDQGRGMTITKVIKRNGKFINVLETPQQIMQAQMEVKNGTYDPAEDNYERVPVPNAPLEATYERQTYRPRNKNFNSEESYNQNRY